MEVVGVQILWVYLFDIVGGPHHKWRLRLLHQSVYLLAKSCDYGWCVELYFVVPLSFEMTSLLLQSAAVRGCEEKRASYTDQRITFYKWSDLMLIKPKSLSVESRWLCELTLVENRFSYERHFPQRAFSFLSIVRCISPCGWRHSAVIISKLINVLLGDLRVEPKFWRGTIISLSPRVERRRCSWLSIVQRLKFRFCGNRRENTVLPVQWLKVGGVILKMIHLTFVNRNRFIQHFSLVLPNGSLPLLLLNLFNRDSNLFYLIADELLNPGGHFGLALLQKTVKVFHPILKWFHFVLIFHLEL